jgi:eukaryotic translation initiation factor 2C
MNAEAFGVKLKNGSIIPAELCSIAPNQRFKGKVPENLTSKVVSFATKKPGERLDAIRKGASQNSLSPVSDNFDIGLSCLCIVSQVLEYANSDFIRESGMQISMQPLAIDGQLLRPPQLQYGRDQIVVSKTLSSLFLY